MEEQKIVDKLKKELSKHSGICDRLFGDMYSHEKYNDKWHDEIFREYQISKARVDLLTEMI